MVTITRNSNLISHWLPVNIIHWPQTEKYPKGKRLQKMTEIIWYATQLLNQEIILRGKHVSDMISFKQTHVHAIALALTQIKKVLKFHNLPSYALHYPQVECRLSFLHFLIKTPGKLRQCHYSWFT
jgi:hypothetical protein